MPAWCARSDSRAGVGEQHEHRQPERRRRESDRGPSPARAIQRAHQGGAALPEALSVVRSGEIEDAVQLVASTVADECQRARGTDPVAVAAARARIDELSIVLEELCRELALTGASA
jgi:hypothetical protein